ncbi:MAG: hypothetical protein GX364_00125 [Firmicutes bacterium]|nr:hypothetical protein [Bacillota bacterium]
MPGTRASEEKTIVEGVQAMQVFYSISHEIFMPAPFNTIVCATGYSMGTTTELDIIHGQNTSSQE